jgi:hypothetical protein
MLKKRTRTQVQKHPGSANPRTGVASAPIDADSPTFYTRRETDRKQSTRVHLEDNARSARREEETPERSEPRIPRPSRRVSEVGSTRAVLRSSKAGRGEGRWSEGRQRERRRRHGEVKRIASRTVFDAILRKNHRLALLVLMYHWQKNPGDPLTSSSKGLPQEQHHALH